MNFEFSLLGGIVALAWLLTVSMQSVVMALFAAAVFFSKSIPINILFLISMNLIGFIQATLGGRKTGNGCTQKRYFSVFLGLFIALFGISILGNPIAYPLVFFGLLLSVSNGFKTLFFYRHYSRLTLKAYVISVVIPAFTALDVLLKIKTDMKMEYAQLWDISLTIVGQFTFIYSCLLAVTENRFKGVLIQISQAAIGLALFLMVVDQGDLEALTLSAIAIFAVSNVKLLSFASQLGNRYFSFAKIATFGLPGFIGFTTLYFALKMTIHLNIAWIIVLGFGFLLQALTLIRSEPVPGIEKSKMFKLRFWVIVLVQLATGVVLYWIEKGGLK